MISDVVSSLVQSRPPAIPGGYSGPVAYLRQQQIIPADRLASIKATVVGVGAIGRQVALQLAAIGVPWLQLIDHDVVEEVNLAPQGYLEADLGRPKVEATADMCRRLNSQVELRTEQARFRRSM